MRVLVAMSGGVDSSVAAALLRDAGHSVVGATMKLWGGPSDSGCCSVADVEDARWVCQQLGIEHHVFNFSTDFERHVVDAYVTDHLAGRTPNPCVECNRHLKFDRFLRRALHLGFDAVATGHHARIGASGGRARLLRGRDGAKDQSYVLAVLGRDQLERVLLPVGELTKAEVRERAAQLGLRTAAKPDSLDVCFITASAGRQAFLSARAELHPGSIVEAGTGRELGTVDAVELVTVGQRRGLASGRDTERRYALSVDVAGRRVVVGRLEDLMTRRVPVTGTTSTSDEPVPEDTPLLVQTSAHGRAVPGRLCAGVVELGRPARRVAPGQTVAFYDGDRVLGAAVAA
jgi:tRNA-specific 2-thiouridylase